MIFTLPLLLQIYSTSLPHQFCSISPAMPPSCLPLSLVGLAAFLTTSSLCLSHQIWGHSQESHQSQRPANQVDNLHSSSSVPSRILHSQLCSRPTVLVSPSSLPSFSEDYIDPDGTPCLPPSCGPPQLPLLAHSHSVISQNLEKPSTQMCNGHTWQDLRSTPYPAPHRHHTFLRTRENIGN